MSGFWNFKSATKWDVMDTNNKKHLSLLLQAVVDRETGVERQERGSYIVFGPEEALLFSVPKTAIQIALDTVEAALQEISKHAN